MKFNVDEGNWIVFGLSWGIAMYIAIELLWPLLSNGTMTVNRLLITFPLWLGMGLLFGYLLHLGRRGQKGGKSA